MRFAFLIFLCSVLAGLGASVTRIATANGNFTAAATWAVVNQSTAAELDSEAGNTATTTSPVYSSTFAPGAITVDAIAVKVAARSNAPSGTVTITLRDSSGSSNMASVTIDVADIPSTDMSAAAAFTSTAYVYPHQWLLVKFGSSVTLGAGTNYTIGVSSSVAGMVNFYRDSTAGNWSRMLRTTTTGAPASTDKLIITGERTAAGAVTARTVTMNNTDTTTFGQIASASFCQSIVVCDRGTLQWDTSAGVVNNLTVAGTFWIGEGGTVTMGTSAVPTPVTSTNRLSFDLTATGDSILTNGNGGTFKTGGSFKEPWAYLYTGVTNGSTSTNYTILPRVSSGLAWTNGDILMFAASSRTFSDTELRTNSTITQVTNGTLVAAGGFGVSHPSTNTDLLCPVGNMTRNVQILGESASLNAVYNAGYASTNDVQFAEFKWMGTGSGNKEGAINFYCGPGSYTANGCALNNTVGYGFYIDGSQSAGGAPVVTSNAVYASGSGAIGIYFGQNNKPGNPPWRAGTLVADNLIYGNGAGNLGSIRFEGNTNGGSVVITNNTSVGATGMGYKISGPFQQLIFHNNTAHSCNQVGIYLNAFAATNTDVRGLVAARNKGGIHITTGKWRLSDAKAFGNANAGFSIDGVQAVTLTNCSAFGETTWAQTNGVTGGFPSVTLLSGISVGDVTIGVTGGWGGSGGDITMIDCTLGTNTQSGATTNVNDIGNYQANAEYTIRAYNTKMVSGNEVVLPANSVLSWVGSEKHDSVSGSNKFWALGGSGFLDTSIANSGSDSQRITPSSASQKFVMPDRYCVRVPVDSSAQRTVSVYVRKSEVGDGAAYNGNQPRLIAKADYALGVTADTVIDTASTTGWEQLTGSTPAVTSDGTLLVYVDCDGTAGWINADDWSFSTVNSLSVGYWLEGFPNIQADNASGGAGGSYTFAQ